MSNRVFRKVDFPSWWTVNMEVIELPEDMPLVHPTAEELCCPICKSFEGDLIAYTDFHQYLDQPSGFIGNGWFEAMICVNGHNYVTWNGDL